MLSKLSLTAVAVVLASLFLPASAGPVPPVTLAWNQNPESDVVGYEVKYGAVGGNDGTTVSAGLNTSISVTGLTDGVTYLFMLYAIDKEGLRSEPAEISYKATFPTPNQAPQSTILQPSSDVLIAEGGVVFFSGSGSDPEKNTPLSYSWDFGSGSGIADSTEPSPGTRIFKTAGTYVVNLTVTDSQGMADPTPATRTITVLPPVVVNQAPDSTISSPSSDTTITVGQTVSFSGSGSDPDGSTPFTYLWNFGSGSGIDDSTSRRPRSLRFNTAGTYVVTFTVTNSLGLADPTPATRTITVNPLVVSNQAPESTILTPADDVAIVVGGTLSFSGGGIDPEDNLPLTYSWNFGSGSGFADSTSQNPGTRRFNTAGTFEVTLTVSDSLGLADPTPATRTITVNAPNQAPESTILQPSSDVSIAEGGVVYFSGSGLDPEENLPLTYDWNFGSGSGIADSSEPSPGTRIFRNAGTYVVTFTASDSLGFADQTPATRTITVLAPNQAPDSTIAKPSSDVIITAGEFLDFAGSGNDPDSDSPLAYLWSIGTSSGVFVSTDQNPGSVRFDDPGTYEASLTVTDAEGLADPSPAKRIVTVLAPPQGANQAPDSTISEPSSDITIAAGQSVRFSGRGDDPDGNMPLTYRWALPSRSRRIDATSPNPGVVQFRNSGTYEVSLTVTDAKGLADPTPATRVITVTAPGSNQAPDSTISAPLSNVIITAGESVDFSGNGSDPDGDLALAYLWNFGSGSGVADSNSQNPGLVRFDNPGIYQVTLTVTDSQGLADPSPAGCMVTVNANPDANKAPYSMISEPSSNVTITAGQSVTFSGVGDDPDNNTPLTYLWNFADGSGIANSTSANPGPKQFDMPGTFDVSFTVTDSKGLADATPAMRTVTVRAPEKSIPGLDGWMTCPESNITISAGESVWFTGFGTNNYSWGTLGYRWNFGAGSGIPDSTEKRPGLLRFDNPGTYEVTFTVINSAGVADPTPARVTITVTGTPRQAASLIVSEPQPVVALESIDGASYMTFSVVKPFVDDNLARIVEVSSDLKTWHSEPEFVTIITDDPRTLKVRTKNPVSNSPCCFFRLKTVPKPQITTRKSGL